MRPERAGFTLLEVLVAFTIAGFALTALLEIFSAGLRTTTAASTAATAALLARSHLAGLGSIEPIVPGEHSGRFDNGYRWAVTVAPEPRAGGEQTGVIPYTVTVTVFPDDARTAGAVRLSTLRLAPAPAAAQP